MRAVGRENDQVRDDLSAVFNRMPDASLRRLYSQRGRLTRGVWRTAGGLACLMALLAEGLPAGAGMLDLESFLRFLSGTAGEGEAGAAVAMAARHLVRLWDGHTTDADVLARYGCVAWLSTETVYSVLQETMERRGMREVPRGEDRRPINLEGCLRIRSSSDVGSLRRSGRDVPPTMGA
ncbi:MAG: hypothetical protein IT428_03860 [Planctomycetaceae bacterium]|nr:hypothetical protein [Planctomycetaceae bacterium]